MPRLIAALVRHGDYHQLANTPSAHQPFPLNDEGRKQARAGAGALFEVIRKNRWILCSSIDCSRMQRAWQTARIIADSLRVEAGDTLRLEEFDALAERGVGCAANLSIEQIESLLQRDSRYEQPPPGWKADSRYRLPLQGAESLLEAGQRVAAHLSQRMGEMSAGVQNDTLKVFVGHGAAFRHAAFHLGVLDFDQLARLSMYHGTPVLLEYRPKLEWRHVGGEWKPRTPKGEYRD